MIDWELPGLDNPTPACGVSCRNDCALLKIKVRLNPVKFVNLYGFANEGRYENVNRIDLVTVEMFESSWHAKGKSEFSNPPLSLYNTQFKHLIQ